MGDPIDKSVGISSKKGYRQINKQFILNQTPRCNYAGNKNNMTYFEKTIFFVYILQKIFKKWIHHVPGSLSLTSWSRHSKHSLSKLLPSSPLLTSCAIGLFVTMSITYSHISTILLMLLCLCVSCIVYSKNFKFYLLL